MTVLGLFCGALLVATLVVWGVERLAGIDLRDARLAVRLTVTAATFGLAAALTWLTMHLLHAKVVW
jgi:hypothetical protein